MSARRERGATPDAEEQGKLRWAGGGGKSSPKEAASDLTLKEEEASVIQECVQGRSNGGTEASTCPHQEMPPTARGHRRDTFDWLKEAIWEESKKASEKGWRRDGVKVNLTVGVTGRRATCGSVCEDISRGNSITGALT